MSNPIAMATNRPHDAFVVEHLDVLSAEVLHWRKTGMLPNGAKLGVLADAMAPGLADQTDAHQMAEHLVILMALRRAAGQI